MFKADIKDAFKLVPVRPEQWRLLGFCWQGSFYYQVSLAFGSRSSPRIFNDLADCLECLFQAEARDTFVRHYLDDFFGIGYRDGRGALETYDRLRAICREIGVPLVEKKCCAPARRMELLGVVLDTQTMTIALPENKMTALHQAVKDVAGKRKCTQRELLSVVGRLVHASKCVPPGRAFTRRLLDAAHSVSGLGHRVRITAEVRADLRWWETFLPLWNGAFPLVPPSGDQSPHVVLHTDSSRWGMGAWCDCQWWMMEWPEQIQQDEAPSMTWLELVPVMTACVVWGKQWAGRRVRIYSDNMGVVGVWGRGWSGDERIMALVRQLLFLTARRQFILDVKYVRTKENGAADALSRNDVVRFRGLRPNAALRPTEVPGCLPAYLGDPARRAHLVTGCRL